MQTLALIHVEKTNDDKCRVTVSLARDMPMELEHRLARAVSAAFAGVIEPESEPVPDDGK